MEALRLKANLEKLPLQLVCAREQERISLARELHDDLGQRLTLLKIKLHHLRACLAGDAAQLIWESADSDVTALMLDLREKTVAAHRAQSMARVGVRDIVGLILFAVKHGLVTGAD